MRNKESGKVLRNINDDFKKYLKDRGIEYKELKLEYKEFEELEKIIEDLFNGELKHYKILDYVSEVDTIENIAVLKFLYSEE